MPDGSFRSPPATPAQQQAARDRFGAYIAATYKPCPACDRQQAGPVHRTNVKLWTIRADRARRHDGVDPVSGVTLADAEWHLAVIRPG
jgi:hypothetical protein